MRNWKSRVLGVAAAITALGCDGGEARSWAMRPVMVDQVFPAAGGGTRTVAALDADEGRMVYVDFCASCHGLDGDGAGPAAADLNPPPRDFRRATLKFTSLRTQGDLPSDDDLRRLIRDGLEGTAMPPWGIDAREIDLVADFIKTFPRENCQDCGSEWQERHESGAKQGQPKRRVGEPYVVPEDPWNGRTAEAIAAGEALYHESAQCHTCHPSYRAGSASTTISAVQNPYGVDVRAPDFRVDVLRSIRRGAVLPDTVRVIASGVTGLMPAWADAMNAEQLWALAHYVSSLRP